MHSVQFILRDESNREKKIYNDSWGKIEIEDQFYCNYENFDSRKEHIIIKSFFSLKTKKNVDYIFYAQPLHE